jgi:2-amino-4-hydroxy-6-hydroxymethyldihydropteridine diphosphokinase
VNGPAPARVFIGAGGNSGDVAATLRRAVARLRRVGRVLRVSPTYRSKAWGVTDQPDFLNVAIALETHLSPHALLRTLKTIERDLGRVKTFRWGPRVIDLDILTYGKARLRDPDLEIPHPRMLERAFVLAPLADLDPSYNAALDALEASERAGVQRIDSRAARSRQTVDWDQTLERVRSAAEFCASAGLARFRIDEADLEIEVRRTVRAVRAPEPEPALEPVHSNGTHAPSNGVASSGAPEPKVLKAEFVGIVRLSRPSIVEGTELAADRELAYVESLGIRNPIRTGGPGRVAQIFVTDGQAVEYGQPLFAIETAS